MNECGAIFVNMFHTQNEEEASDWPKKRRRKKKEYIDKVFLSYAPDRLSLTLTSEEGKKNEWNQIEQNKNYKTKSGASIENKQIVTTTPSATF